MLGNITKNYIEQFENKQTLNKENIDWKRYLNDYPDLRKAGIDNLDGAWNHYTDYGIKEKRTAYIKPEEIPTPVVSSSPDNEVDDNYGDVENMDDLNKLRDKLKSEKYRWTSVEYFPKFAENVIKSLAFLTVYFYLGVNYNILTKSIQLQGGLRGTDMENVPYQGNVSDCDKKEISKDSMTYWSFPYKNSIICNTKSHKTRPFFFRIITWAISTIAFSYSSGRKLLSNFFLSEDDNTMILLGPLIIILLLFTTPIVGWITSLAGIFMNYGKLLPVCWWSFWFPITTHIIFFLGLINFPINIAIIQSITMIYYLLLHTTIGKVDILEDGNKTASKGLLTIIKRVFSNSMYKMLILIIISFHAFKYLGLLFSIPMIIYTLFSVGMKLIHLFNEA